MELTLLSLQYWLYVLETHTIGGRLQWHLVSLSGVWDCRDISSTGSSRLVRMIGLMTRDLIQSGLPSSGSSRLSGSSLSVCLWSLSMLPPAPVLTTMIILQWILSASFYLPLDSCVKQSVISRNLISGQSYFFFENTLIQFLYFFQNTLENSFINTSVNFILKTLIFGPLAFLCLHWFIVEMIHQIEEGGVLLASGGSQDIQTTLERSASGWEYGLCQLL